MRLSLCTITFRHHLIGIETISEWAVANDFDGIELWGVHARNLRAVPRLGEHWLRRQGLDCVMISDYLMADDARQARIWATEHVELALHWGARKIRSFAGATASAAATPEAVRATAKALRAACEVLADRGLMLLIETHPGTLADSTDACLRILQAIDHPSVGVNLDPLHLWEAGDDLRSALPRLAPHIAHCHLKNVDQRFNMAVFSPANVYAASGSRKGMVPLGDGAVAYDELLPLLPAGVDLSLEWFGDNSFATLAQDCGFVRSLTGGWRRLSSCS
ncbi:3-dehydroshikimate dehydratase [Paracoccus halophilus]|uniref:3-dehydroshikimate dehydratase n=1 Tax=Paracoccus halophilus TaxID=376733 RepID=A0A099EXW6_9RHOB|nr:sugar phosphate isomerase/epimerase [Paracoccus halophilus]KGJ02787.1 hypothetical protein IT41_16360 [Paracoccus halophilus]SFA59997.1 3-dehydroshikimate dehydratase [Paracoccus halophilus]